MSREMGNRRAEFLPAGSAPARRTASLEQQPPERMSQRSAQGGRGCAQKRWQLDTMDIVEWSEPAYAAIAVGGTTQRAGTDQAGAAARPRVLVIDDSATYRRAVCEHLAGAGY